MQCIKTYAITVHQNQYIKYFLYGAFTKKKTASAVLLQYPSLQWISNKI